VLRPHLALRPGVKIKQQARVGFRVRKKTKVSGSNNSANFSTFDTFYHIALIPPRAKPFFPAEPTHSVTQGTTQTYCRDRLALGVYRPYLNNTSVSSVEGLLDLLVVSNGSGAPATIRSPAARIVQSMYSASRLHSLQPCREQGNT
jgi:hypothetical protein